MEYSPGLLEWARLSEDVVIVSEESGLVVALDARSLDSESPFEAVMSGPGRSRSTRALLDAAINVGLSNATLPAARPNPTLANYVMDLIGSFHNAGRTESNYLIAAARFEAIGRPELGAYLRRHAQEERGHEKLALRDIDALGLPGALLVERICPPGVAELCALFDSFSSADVPLGCIGYSYFFESSAARRTQKHLDAWQRLGRSGAYVTRFMRAHSSVGSEIDHVDDMVEFIASLPGPDRVAIVKSVYITARAVLEASEKHGSRSDNRLWAEILSALAEDGRPELALAS